MFSAGNHFAHLKIPLKAIESATNNFGDNNQIGQGGFGKVYKGELVVPSGKQVIVAVKRLDAKFGQGSKEFWKEIMMLSRCKHENLVSLLGFSDERNECILVYEYLSNQSLDKYLSTPNLTWIQRLNICIGAARGLEYLHNPGNTTERVVHRDIKSSNILLNQNWNAKISDFGLSKLTSANQEITFAMTQVAGTPGYVDPDAIEGFLSKESDIYSFGVVLFEVLSGRLCFKKYNDGQPLAKLAQEYYKKNEIGAIVHECLREKIAPKCLDNFSQIAYQCLKRDRDERPQIAEIVRQLELALEYQVKDDNIKKEKKLKSHDEVEEDMEPLPLSLSDHPGDESMTEEQLKAYDGRDPDKPLLIAIKGQIYDVSRNRTFYKPGGPYAMFAGKDVSKALAKNPFGEKDLNEDVKDPSPFELEILKDWQQRFRSKYAKVGFIDRARRKNKGKIQIS